MLCRLCWKAESVGYPLALLSSQNPAEKVILSAKQGGEEGHTSRDSR